MGRTVLPLLLASCGFRHGTVPGDSAGVTDDGPATNGDGDPMPIGPWGAPIAFPELTAPGTALDDPTLTSDMLEIYFNSNRGGNDDIWMSTRSTTSSVWNDPTPVNALNTTSRESDPEVSYDGLSIYIASDRPGGAGMDDLYISTRPNRSSPWGTPIRIASLSSPGADDAATTDAAHKHIVLWSTRTGGAGMSDLYEATWGTTSWQTPQRLASLCTPENDYDPFLTPSGLGIFFDSDRTGGAGMQDLYASTRPTLTSEFAAPQPIAELNSAARDMDPWLTPDLRTMVFASNRSGEYEIYITMR